jgi:hypothetical protein
VTAVPPTPTPSLDDVVTRLKTDVPKLIQAAQGSGSTPAPEDAAVVELATLADQVDAALSSLAGPGTTPVTPPAGTPTAPDAPPIAPVPAA